MSYFQSLRVNTFKSAVNKNSYQSIYHNLIYKNKSICKEEIEEKIDQWKLMLLEYVFMSN